MRYIFIDTLFPECEPVELNEYEIDSVIDNGDNTHTIVNIDGLVFIAKDLKKEV